MASNLLKKFLKFKAFLTMKLLVKLEILFLASWLLDMLQKLEIFFLALRSFGKLYMEFHMALTSFVTKGMSIKLMNLVKSKVSKMAIFYHFYGLKFSKFKIRIL